MKKFLCLVLSMTMLLGCFTLNASAAETVYPKVSHTYTSTEDFASDEWITDQRGVYLGYGSTSIARASSNTIHISGDTTATQTVDHIKLVLYVERSTSYATGYGNYRTYIFDADNVYQLAKEIANITVERGYYYRVKGVHSVTENGETELTNSVTDPIDYR